MIWLVLYLCGVALTLVVWIILCSYDHYSDGGPYGDPDLGLYVAAGIFVLALWPLAALLLLLSPLVFLGKWLARNKVKDDNVVKTRSKE